VDVKARVKSDPQVILGSGADRKTSMGTFGKNTLPIQHYHSENGEGDDVDC
jgi:hypothetical protein